MQSVILLISDDTDSKCVGEFQAALGIAVVQAASARSGWKALRERTYSLVLYDTSDADDGTSDLIVKAAGLTPVVEFDLKATPLPVLVRRVRAALSRFATEQFHARNAAIAHLQGELRDSLTGLLLESQLALREVDASKHPKLVNIVQSATKLCSHLKLDAELPRPIISSAPERLAS
jgi:signal transduction histidine kinase